jgi:hypothetical protein
MARSLEESDWSGIQDRLRAWREAKESERGFQEGQAEGHELETSRIQALLTDCFLSPIDTLGPLLHSASINTQVRTAAPIAELVEVSEEPEPKAEPALPEADRSERVTSSLTGNRAVPRAVRCARELLAGRTIE